MFAGVGARRGATAFVVLVAFICTAVWFATRDASELATPNARTGGSSTSADAPGDGSGTSSGKASASATDGKGSPTGNSDGTNGTNGTNGTERASELEQSSPGSDEPAQGPQKQPGDKGFKLPGLSGGITKPPAYLFDHVPADASATGRVVKGYPLALLPAPKGTKVLSSELSSEGTRVRAVFDGRCTCRPDRVFGFYQSALGRLGLDASSAPAVGGSQAKVFANARHTITLTVRKDGKSVEFSLFTVTTARAA